MAKWEPCVAIRNLKPCNHTVLWLVLFPCWRLGPQGGSIDVEFLIKKQTVLCACDPSAGEAGSGRSLEPGPFKFQAKKKSCLKIEGGCCLEETWG